MIFHWLGYLDSNQGNARFRVWCLTAWLYPNQPLNNTTPKNRMQLFFFFLKKGKDKKTTSEDAVIFHWLGYLDSNQGNARFRVWCLTAWLYPNQPLNNTTPKNRMQLFFFFLKKGKDKKTTSEDAVIFHWLGYLDSNQGNARFRVWCLTAWLYPNQPLNNTTRKIRMQPLFNFFQ